MSSKPFLRAGKKHFRRPSKLLYSLQKWGSSSLSLYSVHGMSKRTIIIQRIVIAFSVAPEMAPTTYCSPFQNSLHKEGLIQKYFLEKNTKFLIFTIYYWSLPNPHIPTFSYLQTWDCNQESTLTKVFKNTAWICSSQYSCTEYINHFAYVI